MSHFVVEIFRFVSQVIRKLYRFDVTRVKYLETCWDLLGDNKGFCSMDSNAKFENISLKI